MMEKPAQDNQATSISFSAQQSVMNPDDIVMDAASRFIVNPTAT